MTRPSHALRPSSLERAARGGIVLYILLLVALPLGVLAQFGLAEGPQVWWGHVSAPAARSALWLTLWSALVVGAINTVLGTATAWILVRYKLRGKALLSALVDLPLAMPTLVAGLMLAVLYGPLSTVGGLLRSAGFDVLFAPPGIVLALLFVTLPFVVRAVEPVLDAIDPAEEEAATVLGASRLRIFRTVFLPPLLPVAVSGGIRSVGRAAGEFGAIVVVAGNIPFTTLTAPVFIFGEIESGAARAAACISTVLLAAALILHAAANVLERMTGARRAAE